ncbi:MAG TPA: hypothetical protein PKE21_13390 [Flavobacteriales bacterium]|nr:hypothetical protein [Flavobacteriales bacterium]HMR28469.1 hypothetical protein [Flavobacteriales bacterium]
MRRTAHPFPAQPLPDRWTLLMPGLTILCRVLGVVCGLVALGMG